MRAATPTGSVIHAAQNSGVIYISYTEGAVHHLFSGHYNGIKMNHFLCNIANKTHKSI